MRTGIKDTEFYIKPANLSELHLLRHEYNNGQTNGHNAWKISVKYCLLGKGQRPGRVPFGYFSAYENLETVERYL